MEVTEHSRNAGTGIIASPAHLLISFLAGVAVMCLIGLAIQQSGPDSKGEARDAIVGDLVVDYMYDTSEGTASGGKMEAKHVEFHDNYVVVTSAVDSVHLWATARLRRFAVSVREAEPAQ